MAEKGAKIIVLAHEDKIEDFKELKEKTFGLSLSFKQSYENAINGILKTNFENEESFQKHILSKIEILNVFRNNENLRVMSIYE